MTDTFKSRQNMFTTNICYDTGIQPDIIAQLNKEQKAVHTGDGCTSMPVSGAPCWSLITRTVIPVVLLLTAMSPSLPPDRIIRPTSSHQESLL